MYIIDHFYLDISKGCSVERLITRIFAFSPRPHEPLNQRFGGELERHNVARRLGRQSGDQRHPKATVISGCLDPSSLSYPPKACFLALPIPPLQLVELESGVSYLQQRSWSMRAGACLSPARNPARDRKLVLVCCYGRALCTPLPLPFLPRETTDLFCCWSF